MGNHSLLARSKWCPSRTCRLLPSSLISGVMQLMLYFQNGSPQCASSCNCINYCASTDFIIVFCPQVRTASTQLSSTNPVTWPQLNTGSTSKMPMPASSTQPTESCPAGWTYSDVTRKCYRVNCKVQPHRVLNIV